MLNKWQINDKYKTNKWQINDNNMTTKRQNMPIKWQRKSNMTNLNDKNDHKPTENIFSNFQCLHALDFLNFSNLREIIYDVS